MARKKQAKEIPKPEETSPAKVKGNGEYLERLLLLTERRLRQLAKQGWFPDPVRGVWDIVKTVQGMQRYYQHGSQKREGLKQDKLTEQVRVERAEAEMKEAAAARMRGDLVPMQTLKDVIRDCYLPIRQRMLSLPNEMASRANPSDPEHARDALNLWVDETLKTLRKELPQS